MFINLFGWNSLMRKLVILAEKLGAEQAEIVRIKGSGTSASSEGSRLEKEYSASEGYSVRVLKGGRVGFSYFAKGGNARDAIKRALSLCKFANSTEFSFPEKNKRFPKAKTFDKKVSQLDEADCLKMLREVEKNSIKPAKPSKCGIEFGESEMEIENSFGLSLFENSTHISGFCSCTYKKSSGGSFRSSSFLDFSPSVIGKEASMRAVEMERARPLKAGKMQAVLEPEALQSLVYSLLLPSFNGERAYRKVSALHNMLGKKVASECFCMADDPLYESPATCSFDGEGVASEKKELIEDGILRSFMFDMKTACLAHHLSPTPGNCKRYAYSAEPGIGASSIIIEKGNAKSALEGISSGILISSVFGEHTSNALTGEFSVSVDRGYEIAKGEKHKPARGNVISGNFFELIKEIKAIGRKQERIGSFACPSIAFESIQVV
jgi:PmbA protein